MSVTVAVLVAAFSVFMITGRDDAGDRDDEPARFDSVEAAADGFSDKGLGCRNFESQDDILQGVAYENGVCLISVGSAQADVQIYVFDSDEDQQSVFSHIVELGVQEGAGVLVRGPNWMVLSPDSEIASAVVDAFGGEIVGDF